MGSTPKPKRKQRWRDLPRAQRIAILTLAPIQIVLTGSAALDLLRRPSSQIRGPKALWWPALFVQPVGSIAYLRWGRRAPRGLS